MADPVKKEQEQERLPARHAQADLSKEQHNGVTVLLNCIPSVELEDVTDMRRRGLPDVVEDLRLRISKDNGPGFIPRELEESVNRYIL